MPATRVLSNSHQVEEFIYLDVHQSLLILLKAHEIRTDDTGYDWPYLPSVKTLCAHCIDSSRPIEKNSITILSNAHLCDQNGNVPESIKNIVLSFIRIEKGGENKKNRIIITVPPLNHRGPADPNSWELEVDLGEISQF
jgi:hypothetical protein